MSQAPRHPQRHVNPFRKSFGVVPAPGLLGREQLATRLTDVLSLRPSKPDDECAALFGARGSGKTTTLIELADRARAKGWLVVESAGAQEGGLLEGLAHAVTKTASLLDEGQRTMYLKAVELKLLSVGGVRFERAQDTAERRAASGTQLLEGLVAQAAAMGTGVLLTVDELHAAATEDVVVLGTCLQGMMRNERLPVQFRGAALPHFRNTTLDDERLSFFRRGESIYMEPLSAVDAHRGLQQFAAQSGGSFTPGALELAVEAVEGSPYMFQLVGHYSWSASLAPDAPIDAAAAAQGVAQATDDYSMNVAKSTWNELSTVEQALSLIVHREDAQHDAEGLASRAGDAGFSSAHALDVVEALEDDKFLTADAHGLLSLTPGNGLIIPFLEKRLAMEEARARAVARDVERGVAPGATPSPRAVRRASGEVCGEWMPQARRRCALPKGHAGRHRRKPWTARS